MKKPLTKLNRTIAAAIGLLAAASLLTTNSAAVGQETASFVRALNLNGPPLVIDGRQWEGKDSPHYSITAKAFENQQVTLTPPTDSERAEMIRSSRWGEVDLTLTGLSSGYYSLFIYVWEDNNAETFSIAVNDGEVASRYVTGPAGKWEKLGPWTVQVSDGKIRLATRGGAANLSGVEIWRGQLKDDPANQPDPQSVAFFEQRIRPLLIKHCYECHSADADSVEGDLWLDSRAGVLNGGDSGPAVVPGDIEKSLLIKAVHYEDSELQMPPDGKLSSTEIADLEKWVRIGAPDPRTEDALAQRKKQLALEEARQFWSFQPVRQSDVPAVADEAWPQNDIDRFILAKLNEKNIRPVETADRRTLIRRAAFDLIGLPPTPAEINEFVNDPAPLNEAFKKVVERLLASRPYGERWGRHWMDLVRYADTAGDNSDYPVPQLYLYRNYIINSFNDDKPYDEFLREQIAGDLLPAGSPEEKNEHIIATGYVASSRRFGSIINDYPQHLTIEDTIDNLGRTMLGLSIACARCHNHKFDPISQEDYYGLYGIFESTKYPFPGIELDKKPRDFVPLTASKNVNEKLAYAVSEGKVADARLHRRGEPKELGDPIPRKFLDVLGGQRLPAESLRDSGRLELADWITDPQNPLTARVMVNRIWQFHFGAGLVPTPSDFGSRGIPPTHPDLLDWLAHRFVAEGWSIKQMHRLIMQSRTYQLSSADDSQNLTIDPDNNYRWKFDRRRLDAESLRDAMLAISGDLDETMMTEPHPFPPVDKWQFTQHHPFRESYPTNRRSVYMMTTRLNALPYFTAFDGPDRNATTPVRDSSVTTIQALYLLNDEFLHERSTSFAQRLLGENSDEESRLQMAFELTIGRPPNNEEIVSAAAYFAQLKSALTVASIPPEQHEQFAWESFARVLFRMNEFLYVD